MARSGHDQHGEYVDMVNARPVVDMTGADREWVEEEARHPALRAMVAGLDRMSPPARDAWLAALRTHMGEEGARDVVSMIAAAKRQTGPLPRSSTPPDHEAAYRAYLAATGRTNNERRT